MRNRKSSSLIGPKDVDYDRNEREYLINELTKVVSHFLSMKYASFFGWSIFEIICEKNYIIFEIGKKNNFMCEIKSRHFSDVDQYLPTGFTLKAPVIPSASFKHGASNRTCQLVFDVRKGEKKFKKNMFFRGFLIIFSIFITIFFIMCLMNVISHTSKDADPINSIWQTISDLW